MTRKLFDKLETWIVVTVITVLIWLYAEGAIVETFPRQRVTIEFVGPGNTPVAIEPATVRPLVTFRSSGPTFQKFKELTNDTPLTITLEPEDDPQQQIDITERLEQALFNDLGIALDEVDPGIETVTVRRLVTRQLPIDVITTGLDLKGTPGVEPPYVTIELPENLAELLERQSAFIRLDEAVGNNPPAPGVPESLSLAIELPPGIVGRWTTTDINQAQVSFTIDKVDATLTLASVPLEFLIPTNFPFTIETENNERIINDVELTGPSDTLTKIENGDIEVQAVLRFNNAAALTPGKRTVDITFITPPGVTTRKLPQINVILTPKSEPAATNSNGE